MKSLTVSIVSPSISHEVMGLDTRIFVFLKCCVFFFLYFVIQFFFHFFNFIFKLYNIVLVLRQLFHSPLSLSSRGSLVFLCFLPKGWCHLHI